MMFRLYVFFVICILTILIRNVVCVIPSYIKICKKHDPNLNDCITDTIQNFLEKMDNGIPELEIIPIDPLVLNNIRIMKGTESAKLDINLTEVLTYGTKNFKLRDVKANYDDILFNFGLDNSKLDIVGKYQINTVLSLFKLSGKGDFTATITGYKSDITMKGNKIRKNDIDYIKFDKIKIVIKMKDIKFNLKNLVNGEPLLGQILNEVINSSNQTLMEEITPPLEKSLSDLLTDVSNKAVSQFMYDELFPEN